ncbi:MAG: PDZ domain-containing protein [Clostridia bacterium]|nr:PDZ domain-containing protein [Clostridia bacterium]
MVETVSEENKNINTDNTDETEENEACLSDGQPDSGEADIEESLPEKKEQKEQKPRGERRITLGAFLFSAVALVLAAVMLTYTCCNSIYRRKLAEAKLENVTLGDFSEYDELDLLSALFRQYSYYDIDDDEMVRRVMKAYVAATGDRYAAYYTAEEYNALLADTAGEGVGIGISIISNTAPINGGEYNVIEIIGISPESPAESAGLKVGDLIVWIGTGENREPVSEMNYDNAVLKLRGDEGSMAEFTVLRDGGEGEYEELEFSVERKKVESVSVYSTVSEAKPEVGIIRIENFDLTVPTQFSKAVDELEKKGCTKFVFDLRYNMGGDLESIKAVLSYFLSEGDTILSTRDKAGNDEVISVKTVTHENEAYSGCDISAEDIGKYAHLKGKIAVLCNGMTASAAELFVAAMRDYELADTVGETTYGKGSMQSTISLSYFGYTGAVKLTTKKYFPPCGEGYDGIGITPEYEVEQSEEAKDYNRYVLPQSLDAQLTAALGCLDK